MVKPGRPTKHTKANFVSWIETDGTQTFFELDHKGNIIKKNGSFHVHHIKQNNSKPQTENSNVCSQNTETEQDISEPATPLSLSPIITLKQSTNSSVTTNNFHEDYKISLFDDQSTDINSAEIGFYSSDLIPDLGNSGNSMFPEIIDSMDDLSSYLRVNDSISEIFGTSLFIVDDLQKENLFNDLVYEL